MSDITTIDNAMQGQIPGTVTLQIFKQHNKYVEFTPFFKNIHDFWVGYSDNLGTMVYPGNTNCTIISIDSNKYSMPITNNRSSNNNNVDTFSVGIMDIGKITKITKSEGNIIYGSISRINLNNGETRGTVDIGGILFEIKSTYNSGNYGIGNTIYTVSRRSTCGQAVFTSFV